MVEILRRDVLRLAGGTLAGWLLNSSPITRAQEPVNHQETEENTLSRKEHFQPFNKGNAEWQYVEFQYLDGEGQRVGITTSISELTSPLGVKTQQFLVMRHNLGTKETLKRVYDGTRVFDETTSSYTFIEKDTNKQLVKLSYDEAGDRYLLEVKTDQFDSGEIDSGGLVLRPQGDLIPVSGDGNFTVASFKDGRIITNYFADHVRVEKQNGDLVGWGRRDSENLELEGIPPRQLDIDHTWVHVTGVRADGKPFYVTAWASKTGGQFRFADILILDPATGKKESFGQYNEDNPDFSIVFESPRQELETPPGQTKKPEYQMAHGGKVTARLGDIVLFELKIDGDRDQIIDGKGFLSMVEAHGRLTGGAVLGSKVTSDLSAVWETTDERYSSLAPCVMRQN